MAKQNIVLLHGWGSNVSKLQPLKTELLSLGWRVLVVKLPGFDLDSPENVWGNLDYANFVLTKAKIFFGGQKYFLFGHSFGGGVTIQASLTGNKNIVSIILCSSGRITKPNKIKKTIFFVFSKIGKILNFVPKVAGFYRKIIYKLAREHDYEKANGMMKEIFKRVVGDNLRDEVKNLKTPTLILWGTDDRMTPLSDAKFLSKNINSSKLIVFKGEGHRLPYNKPAEIAKEINLWSHSI